jgi:Tfp pilus assembly protein PilV
MPARVPQRGISLVEALVALAVMAFGMLAIVGIQSTMRHNADVAKQRSEAVRLAQQEIERLRAFSLLEPAPSGAGEPPGPQRSTYADILQADDAEVTGYTTNTTYTLSRAVLDAPERNHKTLRVTVAWTDRSNALQQVVLDSVIARSDPLAFSALATPMSGPATKRPRGRHAAIPVQAQDMGNGTSAFKPPQAEGGSAVWVFDNVTGMITGLCDVAGTEFTLEAIANCSHNTLAHLLSGNVRFALAGEQPDATEAQSPRGKQRRLDIHLFLTTPATWAHPGPPICYDDAPEVSTLARTEWPVSYYCLIPANAQRVWSGFSVVVPLAFTDDPESAWSVPVPNAPVGTHRQCRYTPATSDEQVVPNWQHPRHYRIEYYDPETGQQPIPMPPLPNQNFLIVKYPFTCPTDQEVNLATGNFVNSNTLEHWPY